MVCLCSSPFRVKLKFEQIMLYSVYFGNPWFCVLNVVYILLYLLFILSNKIVMPQLSTRFLKEKERII